MLKINNFSILIFSSPNSLLLLMIFFKKELIPKFYLNYLGHCGIIIQKTIIVATTMTAEKSNLVKLFCCWMDFHIYINWKLKIDDNLALKQWN